MDGDIYLRLENGARYSRWWCDQTFNASDFFDSISKQCANLNDLQLTDVEHVLLCMVQMTNTGKPNTYFHIMHYLDFAFFAKNQFALFRYILVW